jgi:iron only hydrogenase large subunit-like protein
MFSGTIKLANIDDYITPANACVKPVAPAEDGKIQPLTLKDCLACSGCVTSAETILAEKQSLGAFLGLPPGRAVVGLSPQAVLHTAAEQGVSPLQAHQLLAGYFRARQARAVLGMRMANLVSLLLLEQEYRARHQAGHLPLLLSECPGWVCYCEKLAGEKAVALLSRVKSPQQVFGILAKDHFGADSSVVTLMPCYDKKLESARYAYEKEIQEVDVVLTLNEISEDFKAYLEEGRSR